MHKAAEYYVPMSDVHCIQREHDKVLSSPGTNQHRPLSATGEEVWALLQGSRRTVDRLVMAMARRSSGQALAQVPDRVIEELDGFVSQGFVRRVADL
ncbi:MAG: PqqD family peptide modification chaperone [bacterium]